MGCPTRVAFSFVVGLFVVEVLMYQSWRPYEFNPTRWVKTWERCDQRLSWSFSVGYVMRSCMREGSFAESWQEERGQCGVSDKFLYSAKTWHVKTSESKPLFSCGRLWQSVHEIKNLFENYKYYLPLHQQWTVYPLYYGYLF